MTDQTHRGDGPLAPDLVKERARRAPSERKAARRGPGRTIVIGGAALGIMAAAGASWGAVTFLGEIAKPRRADIVTSRVDYPDLKDGVPALVSPKGPVRIIGTGSASTAQEVAAVTAPPVDNRALAALAGGGAVPRPVVAAPAPPVQVAAPATPTPQVTRAFQSPTVTASISASGPRVEPPKVAPPVVPMPTAVTPAATAVLPLPTPRPAAPPVRTASRPAETARSAETIRPPETVRPTEPPRAAEPLRISPPTLGAVPAAPPRPARAAAARPTPTRPPVQAPAAPPEPAQAEEDHVNVFGLAVPTIGATGRRLRESVEALGDAVSRL